MLIERLLRRVMEFRCKITEQRHLVANYSMQRGRVDSVAGGWLVNKFITQLSQPGLLYKQFDQPQTNERKENSLVIKRSLALILIFLHK